MPGVDFAELELATAEDIVLQDSEVRQTLLAVAQRQAGGANKGGRYDKHDTTRLRFIRDKAPMSSKESARYLPGPGRGCEHFTTKRTT